jgi:transketolase
LLSTGSEVQIAMQAYEQLTKLGMKVRVVSMPSWELFRKQSAEYRHKVLPPQVKVRVAIEAGSPMGWHEWVGDYGKIIALNHFGASAPYEVLAKRFGLTAEAVTKATKALLTKAALSSV